MGPFDDLTEVQRQQIREAHAANKEREMREVPERQQAWHWAVDGTRTRLSPGAMERPFEDSGVLEADSGLHVLLWLLNVGGEWGGLDTGQEFTITIRPAEPGDGQPDESYTSPDDIACGQADETGEDEAR
jgi:hypothetical protein